MEDVWTIDVDQDAGGGIALGVAVARDVRSPFEYLDSMAGVGKTARDHGAREPGAGHAEQRWFQGFALSLATPSLAIDGDSVIRERRPRYEENPGSVSVCAYT
jgi:hypothetical protein